MKNQSKIGYIDAILIEFNSYNNPTFIPQNELLNVLSKTILALAYTLSEYTIKEDKLRFWF